MYKMPYSNYEWMTESEIAKTDFANVDITTEDFGFIAEVDLIVRVYIFYIFIFI
jgi:hypothetical protein